MLIAKSIFNAIIEYNFRLAMFIKHSLRTIKTYQALLNHRSAAQIHTGKKSSIVDIRNELNNYKGGSVDLIRQDNGIAHLLLNHSDRRNALSDSMMVDMADAVD